jgi:hypothetical protein
MKLLARLSHSKAVHTLKHISLHTLTTAASHGLLHLVTHAIHSLI